MQQLEPTYLRYVYDGLSKGSISSNNPTSLPIGFIGLFEDEFPSSMPLVERMSILNRLATWALFKGPISIEMVAEVLNEHPDKTKALVDTYSKWFNSPEPGKYVLYHDRLRTYLLQKLSDHGVQDLNETLISYLENALNSEGLKEAESYALEHLSTHLVVESQLGNNFKRFSDFVNNEKIWSRQIKASKEYKWSQIGLQFSVKESARRFNELNTVKSVVNSINIYKDEQSNIQNIIIFFYDKEYNIVLERIKRLQPKNKYKLSIFLLHELLFDFKIKEDDNKEICRLIINSLTEINVVNCMWHNEFPVTFMYNIHLALKKIQVDDSLFWNTTDRVGKGVLSFDSCIEELLDSDKRKEKAKFFLKKFKEIEENNKVLKKEISSHSEFDIEISEDTGDGYKYLSKYKVYYLTSYLATYNDFGDESIDLFDIIKLYRWQNKNEDLFRILNFHLKRSYNLSKSFLKKVLKNNIYYNVLPGDDIISIINKSYLGNNSDLRIKFHKMLEDYSEKRKLKFNINCEFYQDIENRKSLLNIYQNQDNIFKRLNKLDEFCENIKFNENEKKYIEHKCKIDLKTSNIHSAHLATAYVKFSKILLKIGNINDAYNYVINAFNDKQVLYKQYLNSEDLKEKIGDVYTIINNTILIFSNQNLNQKKRDSLFDKIKSLINIYIETNFDRSNLLSFFKVNKLKDGQFERIEENYTNEWGTVYQYSWGFNLLLNSFLIGFHKNKDPLQSEILFNSFKKIIKSLELSFLLEINQKSNYYLESLLKTNLGGSLPDVYKNVAKEAVELSTVINPNKIIREENLITNILIYYQNYIVLLLENKLFDKALFYFNEYSKNYHFEKIKDKFLKLIFQQIYYNFIIALLKKNQLRNKNMLDQELKFYNSILEKIPESKLNEIIFDIVLFIQLIERYGVTGLVKKIFNAINKLSKRSLTYEQLNETFESLIDIKIALYKINVDLELIIEESILILKERLYYLLKENGIETEEFWSKLLNNFIAIVKKANKTASNNISKYFDDDMIKVLSEISKKHITESTDSKRLYNLRLVVDLMNLLDRNKEAKYFNAFVDEQITTTYFKTVKILTSGFVLYNPIQKKYENSFLIDINQEEDIYILIDNYEYLNKKQKTYLNQISPIPIIKNGDTIAFDDSELGDSDKFFDLGYLFLYTEEFEKGMALLNKISGSLKKRKSLAHYYAVKLLLKKRKYTLANLMHKRILYSYFYVLSLFEFYKY